MPTSRTLLLVAVALFLCSSAEGFGHRKKKKKRATAAPTKKDYGAGAAHPGGTTDMHTKNGQFTQWCASLSLAV